MKNRKQSSVIEQQALYIEHTARMWQ